MAVGRPLVACGMNVGWTLAGRGLNAGWTCSGQVVLGQPRPAHLPSTSQPVGLSMDLTVYRLSFHTMTCDLL